METEDNQNFDQEIYFKDCVKTVKTHTFNKKMERLKVRFNEETDLESRKLIANEISFLIKEKNKLK